MGTQDISRIMEQLEILHDEMRDMRYEVNGLSVNFEAMEDTIKPIAKTYGDAQVLSKFVKVAFAVLVSLGSAYLLYKNIVQPDIKI